MEHSERTLAGTSQYEVVDHGTITSMDPERAHKAAGDPGYQRRVPGCGSCEAKGLAEKALKKVFEKAQAK